MTLRTVTIDSQFFPIKRTRLFWAFGWVVILGLGVVLSNLVSASPDALTQSSSEADLMVLTNLARHDAGLSALSWNEHLYQAAQTKANDMFRDQYFDHTSPAGLTAWSFIHATDYQYLSAGENLAEGFVHDDAVVRAWLQSPTHRANLLDPHFTDVAIATKTGMLNGQIVTVVVQLFGQPSSLIALLTSH